VIPGVVVEVSPERLQQAIPRVSGLEQFDAWLCQEATGTRSSAVHITGKTSGSV